MLNSISGGTTPCVIANEIWNKIYANKPLPETINNDKLVTVKLDKISYEQDGKLVLADENSPERYIFYAKIKSHAVPKISR